MRERFDRLEYAQLSLRRGGKGTYLRGSGVGSYTGNSYRDRLQRENKPDRRRQDQPENEKEPKTRQYANVSIRLSRAIQEHREKPD